MCEDAICTMKASPTGTTTTHLIDVLEAAFGVAEDEEDIPEIDVTGPETEENLPSEVFVTKADIERSETGEVNISTPSASAAARSSSSGVK